MNGRDEQETRQTRTGVSKGRRAVVAILTIAIIVVLSRVFQDYGATRGSTQVPTVLPLTVPTVTGNCADARATANDAAGLAMLAGRPVVQLQLAPAHGCAASGQALLAYRSRVRSAQLTVVLTSTDWNAASARVRRQLPPALLHGLRHVYPHARCQVIVSVDGQAVARASA